MTLDTPAIWPERDGTPIACREKLKVLTQNHTELAQIMRDAFEDAILMGVDETALRWMLIDMVTSLQLPKRL